MTGPVAQAYLSDSTAANDVLCERFRQIMAEGWSLEHDDEAHDCGDLAGAASAYALNAACQLNPYHGLPLDEPPDGWPEGWTWKPKDPRRDLVRAAALIIAEIERIDRAEARKAATP